MMYTLTYTCLNIVVLLLYTLDGDGARGLNGIFYNVSDNAHVINTLWSEF